MIKNILILLVFSAVVLFARPYGDAGCGLGSIVFKGNSSKMGQTCAATTNGMFYSQMFGITSGTSNCVDHEKAAIEQEMFVAVNFENLTKDMAKGKGQHLTAFSKMLGCKNIKKKEFDSVIKDNFEKIYPDTNVTPKNLLNTTKNVLNETPSTKGKCSYTTTL